MKTIKIIYTLLALFLFPALTHAADRVIHVEWQYNNTTSIAGYRLYHENSFLCETEDSEATSLDCSLDVPDGETWFTMTTFLANGMESQHSQPFTYIFASDLEASFVTDVHTGNSPLPVEFDASSSTGNISTYHWMFGDGHSATGKIVNHTYTAAGSYTAKLTVTDNIGATDQETVTITVTTPPVNNDPPVARISVSKSVGTSPLLVAFNASESSDEDGTIISYHWDFGDGQTSSGAKVSHTYTTPGTYNPTLTVTDNHGMKDSVSVPILVKSSEDGNLPPTAVIAVTSEKGKAPLTVTFDASDSTDPDGAVSFCSWHFGDGTTSSSMSTKHTFTQPGKYTVTLCVTDNEGANSKLAKVVIQVQDPDKEEDLQNIIAIIEYLLLND